MSKKFKIIKKINNFVFFGLIFVSFSASAEVNISQQPLFLSSEVKPNVMIMLDNSGSMDNLVWDEDYDSSITYPSWAQKCFNDDYNRERYTADRYFVLQNGKECTNNDIDNPSANLTGNNSHIQYGSETENYVSPSRECPNSYILGRRVEVTGYRKATRITKCLRLPTPASSDNHYTRYTVNYINYLFNVTDSRKYTLGSDYCNEYGNNYNINSTCEYYEAVDLRDRNIPQTTRMQSARSVAKNVVRNNEKLLFGLAGFNPPTSSWYQTDGAPGGEIIAGCGTSRNNLINEIDNFRADSNTPLAETFYEITRYFRGMSTYYNGYNNYTSPIKYRCQKNFVIVITDGLATYDNSFPNNDRDAGRRLPDWDGLSPYTSYNDYPNFPRDSDGFNPTGSESDEGYTLYLDDLAKFGYDIDMMPYGNDITGAPFNSPGFGKRNLTTYTVGFSIGNQNLKDAARKGGGQYYTAGNEEELIASLNSAIADINARTSSASSVATNSTRLATDTLIFQAKFRSNEWVGDLLAFNIQDDGGVASNPTWSAKDSLPPIANRKIFTLNDVSGNGVSFEWDNLSNNQKNYLNTNFFNENDNLGRQRLDYIKGYSDNEVRNGGIFRDRATPLGDIVNSDPYFASQLNYHFEAIPSAEGKTYQDFRKSAAYKNRLSIVYIASNDGMLHAFNGNTGEEVFGYIPSSSYPRLSFITSQTFAQNHKYVNDGSPNVVDAYYDNKWHTVLLGSTGAGGRGFYALNVTSPQSFGTNDIMWEFSDKQDNDMGYTISQGSVVRASNGKWVALLPNGYDSPGGGAVLFIVDLESGNIIKKIHTGVSGDNGLSSVLPVDMNGDKITDYVYAGDLKGNMWKFDISSSKASDWNVALGGQPLFKACSGNSCNGDNYQPITSRPEAILNPGNNKVPGGGLILLFGTGSYFSVDDNVVLNANNQSFYGIYDRNSNESQPVLKDNLLKQEVLGSKAINYKGEQTSVRITSQKTLNQASLGWYIDLPIKGEKQVSRPVVRNGRVIFSTLIPNTEPCQYGGNSWLMELEALTGSRLSVAPFDIDENQKFDNSDKVDFNNSMVDLSGIKIQNGIIKTPTVVSKDSIEFKYASSTSGEITKTIESGEVKDGRESWIQIR